MGLLVLLAAALPGCATIYYDFIYQPQIHEGAPSTELKIAIIPFEDLRETYQRGTLAWSYLPLVPRASRFEDRRQSPAARQESDYYFPDLLAYTAALELVANDVSRRVDIAPPALEDYDLILHGAIHSTTEWQRRFSYGLGFLSFVTGMVGWPQGTQGVELDITYSLYDGTGDALGETRIRQEWSPLHWGQKQPQMDGRVETTLQANAAFMAWLIPQLESPPLAPHDQVRDERLRRYHAMLDPELSKLIAERDRVRQKPGALWDDYEARLQREILKRGVNLEMYRRAEQKIVASQQAHVYEAQHLRLRQIAQVRESRREIEARQRAAEQAYNSAVIGSLGTALLAGAAPTLSAAQGSSLTDMQQAQLAQDLTNAFASMPPPPPLPPDLSPLLDELKVDMAGLPAAGGVLEGLDGEDIPDLRRAFLARYRERTTSLAQIQAQFKAAHGKIEQ